MSSSRRRRVAAVALLGGLALLARTARAEPAKAPAAEPDAGEWRTDVPSGHRFRAGFDPASRVTVGVAGAVARGPDGKPAPAPEIDVGIAYRTVRSAGAGKDLVSWQIEHRFISGFVLPRAAPRPMDAALYGVALMRHDESPSLVLPMSPPIGIPFPFDVGFDAEAGRVTVASYAPAGAPRVRVGVLRAALLLAPWRPRARGRIFAIGLGARYDLDVTRGDDPRPIHRVAPMTAGSARLRVESADGLMVADVRAEAAACWSTDRTWGAVVRGTLHLERTLLAIADQPLTAFLDGGYRLDPPAGAGAPVSDFHASLGLAFHLGLQ